MQGSSAAGSNTVIDVEIDFPYEMQFKDPDTGDICTVNIVQVVQIANELMRDIVNDIIRDERKPESLRGDGSQENPYILSTWQDWVYVSQTIDPEKATGADKQKFTALNICNRKILIKDGNMYVSDWGAYKENSTELEPFKDIETRSKDSYGEFTRRKNGPSYHDIQNDIHELSIIICFMEGKYSDLNELTGTHVNTKQKEVVSELSKKMKRTYRLYRSLREAYSKKTNRVIAELMQRVLGNQIDLSTDTTGSKLLATLVAMLFIAESWRNPVSLLSGLMIIDLMLDQKLKGKYNMGDLFSMSPSTNTIKFKNLYGDTVENLFVGMHPMAHLGSFEEMAKFKSNEKIVDAQLNFVQQKDGRLLLHWLTRHLPLELNPKITKVGSNQSGYFNKETKVAACPDQIKKIIKEVLESRLKNFANFDTLKRINIQQITMKLPRPMTPAEFYKKCFEAIHAWDECVVKKTKKHSRGKSRVKKSLKEQVALFGYQYQDTKGNGKCFFHAVKNQLKEHPHYKYTTAKSLEEIVAQHIIDNINFYSKFAGGDANTIVEKIIKKTALTDRLVIQALSRALNINIVIVRSDKNKPAIVKQADSTATIYLGYEAGMPYQSLVRNKEKSPKKDISPCLHTAKQDTFIGDPLILETTIDIQKDKDEEVTLSIQRSKSPGTIWTKNAATAATAASEQKEMVSKKENSKAAFYQPAPPADPKLSALFTSLYTALRIKISKAEKDSPEEKTAIQELTTLAMWIEKNILGSTLQTLANKIHETKERIAAARGESTTLITALAGAFEEAMRGVVAPAEKQDQRSPAAK